MKNKAVLFWGLIAVVIAMPVMGLADDTIVLPLEPDPVLSFISQVLAYFESQFPVVGEIMKWVGVVASIGAVLSYAVQAVLMVPEIAARWSGAPGLADKIKYWSDKIVYFLKYISTRNAQKQIK
jgi:hypothetical protein